MIVACHVGKRTPDDAMTFMEKLGRATRFARFQLSSDGFTPYPSIVADVFGPNVDYGQMPRLRRQAPEAGRLRSLGGDFSWATASAFNVDAYSMRGAGRFGAAIRHPTDQHILRTLPVFPCLATGQSPL
jgi:hypothetical protein